MYVAQKPTDSGMSLNAELIRRLAGANNARTDLPTAYGASFHSGRVRAGDAFFALPGANGHGIEHADRAIEAGAVFVVSDRPHARGMLVEDPASALLALGRYARERISGPVVGISGSAGKTSTKAFVAAALQAASSPGNFNTPLALSCTLLDAWLQDPARPLVLEMGIDRPGEMDELLDLVQPTHGLLTAIAEAHLEQLGSLEGVAHEKSRLLVRSTERFASSGAAKKVPLTLAGLVVYGLDADARVRGRILSSDAEGQLVEALGVQMRIPYLGTSMAENAVAALALAWRMGLEPAEAAARIELVRLEPGRLERKLIGSRTILDDSYNSNPASARQALEVLRSCAGPRTAVLGDMLELGEESAQLHRELGLETVDLDLVLSIGKEARYIGESNPEALHADDAEEALPLLQGIPPGGTVLVKGSRGMRLERIVDALASMEHER